MAKKAETKQFNFEMWLENYQWLNEKSVEERCSMTRYLNILVTAERLREKRCSTKNI